MAANANLTESDVNVMCEAQDLADQFVIDGLTFPSYQRLRHLCRLLQVDVEDMLDEARTMQSVIEEHLALAGQF